MNIYSQHIENLDIFKRNNTNGYSIYLKVPSIVKLFKFEDVMIEVEFKNEYAFIFRKVYPLNSICNNFNYIEYLTNLPESCTMNIVYFINE